MGTFSILSDDQRLVGAAIISVPLEADADDANAGAETAGGASDGGAAVNKAGGVASALNPGKRAAAAAAARAAGSGAA
jgi:hypothetical protein